jgi:translation initiation factor IF-1
MNHVTSSVTDAGPLALELRPAGLRYTVDLTAVVGCMVAHFFQGRRMSKEDSIEVTGTVVEKFPSGLFSVQLDQDRTVLAHLAGKLRRNRIRVLAGDRVTLEMSPYDLTKGRITYRHK